MVYPSIGEQIRHVQGVIRFVYPFLRHFENCMTCAAHVHCRPKMADVEVNLAYQPVREHSENDSLLVNVMISECLNDGYLQMCGGSIGVHR